MQDWMLPRITDYWDQRVGAIERLSRALKAIPSSDYLATVTSLRAAIVRHVGALTDQHLLIAAVALADDLYKAADESSYWDEALEQYLTASAETFFGTLSSRGYQVNYVIDNSYDDLNRPTRFYPMWFRAAGIIYICPQHMASRVMEHDGVSESDWSGEMERYIQEGRHIASQVVSRCRTEKRSFVFLAIDGNEECLKDAYAAVGSPGVIGIFRKEAPIPGSGISVTMPKLLHS
jgi:hypothetical protein